MSSPVVLLRASSGLNTMVDPVRLVLDPDALPLKAAYNIDYDNTGRISRRKGTTATDVTASCHSLFCDGGECFFVTGTSLCALNADYSYDTIATVAANVPVYYLELDNKTYWSNGLTHGIISNRTNASWSVGTYSGPDSTRTYYPPPDGTLLAYHGSCVLIASGSVIYHSDPYFPTGFDLARNYIALEGPVRMLRPVAGGIWVSDNKSVGFFKGTNMRDMQYRKVAQFPAVKGSDVEADLSVVGEGALGNVGVLWTSADGICAGTDDGKFINLTKTKIEDLPVADNGAATMLRDRYICAMGDITAGTLGVCMELTGARVSQYAGYDFNSFAKFNNQYLGAGNNGIFVLDSGDYDYQAGSQTNIDSFFETVLSDMGAGSEQRVRFVTVEAEFDGPLSIQMTCNETESHSKAVGRSRETSISGAYRVTGRRDIKGRFWSFRVDNVGGSDYSIDRLIITPVVTGRQPRT